MSRSPENECALARRRLTLGGVAFLRADRFQLLSEFDHIQAGRKLKHLLKAHRICSACHAGGRGFEPRRSRQFPQKYQSAEYPSQGAPACATIARSAGG